MPGIRVWVRVRLGVRVWQQCSSSSVVGWWELPGRDAACTHAAVWMAVSLWLSLYTLSTTMEMCNLCTTKVFKAGFHPPAAKSGSKAPQAQLCTGWEKLLRKIVCCV